MTGAVVGMIVGAVGFVLWKFYDPHREEKRQAMAQIVCPQCRKRGAVTTQSVVRKKGISGGKATGALFTFGASMLLTGLSRKEHGTEAHCSNCGSTWSFA